MQFLGFPCALLALALLTSGCAHPCASCRIDAFVGKGIGDFMKDSALVPRTVLPEAAGGKTYVFEVNYLATEPVPPVGPATPMNIENSAPRVQLNPTLGAAGPDAGPRVAPGTPTPTVLTQVPVVRVRILRVRTTAEGIILDYACKAS